GGGRSRRPEEAARDKGRHDSGGHQHAGNGWSEARESGEAKSQNQAPASSDHHHGGGRRRSPARFGPGRQCLHRQADSVITSAEGHRRTPGQLQIKNQKLKIKNQKEVLVRRESCRTIPYF